jgi:predicted porin
MNKKLMAVAVAGVLAVPGLALAQSSVRISGYFKVGVDNYKVSQTNAARAGANNSENRVSDSASRIIFGVTEDLGGGLSAIAQMDLRFNPDAAAPNTTAASQIGTGNTFVGLRSKTMGTVVLGRRDTHFGGRNTSGNRITDQAGALQSSACALMCYVNTNGVAAVTGIGVVGRSPNLIAYDSPRWGGFGFTLAYSMNAASSTAVEADSTSVARKGRAWNINPSFLASNWGVEYSHWNSKPDAPVAATNDQKGDLIGGYFTMAGFRVGLAYDRSRLTNSLTGVQAAKRTAWTLPLSYSTGPHTGYFEYTKAGDNKTTAAKDGAKLLSVGYNYALSKRTAVAVVLSKLNNDPGANYQSYSNTGGSGNAASTLTAGEDGRLVALTLKHAF